MINDEDGMLVQLTVYLVTDGEGDVVVHSYTPPKTVGSLIIGSRNKDKWYTPKNWADFSTLTTMEVKKRFDEAQQIDEALDEVQAKIVGDPELDGALSEEEQKALLKKYDEEQGEKDAV